MHLVLKWWTTGGVTYGQAYANGMPVGNPTSFTNYQNGDYIVVGGFNSSGTENASGQIDEVKIFNYALTEDQVKTLYNDGAINFH
jgi:hypothetical protein